jgi:acyl dehydratase
MPAMPAKVDGRDEKLKGDPMKSSVSPDALRALVGRELGVSGWLTVDQAMIDAFAAATGDFQFIHVDPVQAAATPFGGTVAHGFLTLSLLPRLAAGTLPEAPDICPSVTRATRSPRSCRTDSVGVSECSSGMPLARGP